MSFAEQLRYRSNEEERREAERKIMYGCSFFVARVLYKVGVSLKQYPFVFRRNPEDCMSFIKGLRLDEDITLEEININKKGKIVSFWVNGVCGSKEMLGGQVVAKLLESKKMSPELVFSVYTDMKAELSGIFSTVPLPSEMFLRQFSNLSDFDRNFGYKKMYDGFIKNLVQLER